MTPSDIARLRLINQHISAPRFSEPAKVVEWLAAVQAQDFEGAKWSLGLRMLGAKDGGIEQAFSEGAILRTHLLRPTWHFVTPTDIRWMLALTALRVHQANAYMYRKLGLDNAVLKRSNAALATSLPEKQLTRDELREVLQRAGIQVDGEFRMGYLLMRAELDGIICSGGRRGKQFTYALFDDRVPPSQPFRRDEALAELARRYFRSRGPPVSRTSPSGPGLRRRTPEPAWRRCRPTLNMRLSAGGRSGSRHRRVVCGRLRRQHICCRFTTNLCPVTKIKARSLEKIAAQS